MLHEQVVQDWKSALKNKDPKKDALSLIITEFKNRAIKDNVPGEQGRTASDASALDVLQKMAKQRREAIDAYKTANRPDLVQKEELELSVVESYLPKPLSDDELSDLVKKVIKDTKAASMKDMGMVMAASIKAAKGQADGKRIQSLVQKLLH